ncbi:hypothetical protein ACLEPN_42380, partial [Myxococcus sp. 1LA]
MKFLCDACERLVPLETFRTESGGLVVTCGRCGVDSRVSPSGAAAPPFESLGAPPPTPAPMPLPGDSGVSRPCGRAALRRGASAAQ